MMATAIPHDLQRDRLQDSTRDARGRMHYRRQARVRHPSCDGVSFYGMVAEGSSSSRYILTFIVCWLKP